MKKNLNYTGPEVEELIEVLWSVGQQTPEAYRKRAKAREYARAWLTSIGVDHSETSNAELADVLEAYRFDA